MISIGVSLGTSVLSSSSSSRVVILLLQLLLLNGRGAVAAAAIVVIPVAILLLPPLASACPIGSEDLLRVLAASPEPLKSRHRQVSDDVPSLSLDQRIQLLNDALAASPG